MSGAVKIHGRRKGDKVERAVVLDQERLGRVAFRVRQGGGEPVDVVAVQAWPNPLDLAVDCGQDGPRRMTIYTNVPERIVRSPAVYFIQVKASSPYLAPAECEAFMLRAKAAGAVPMVAWKSKTSRKLEYKVLSGGEA